MMLAKVFDTPHGQLLLTKDFDEDAGGYILTARGEDFSGVSPSIAFALATRLENGHG